MNTHSSGNTRSSGNARSAVGATPRGGRR
jgi:hypothetical protein